jgi:hypothetical protein
VCLEHFNAWHGAQSPHDFGLPWRQLETMRERQPERQQAKRRVLRSRGAPEISLRKFDLAAARTRAGADGAATDVGDDDA